MTAKGHLSMAIMVTMVPFSIAHGVSGSWIHLPSIFWYFDFSPGMTVLFMGIVLGSVMPDIDEKNSAIGRRTRGISDMLSFAIGHRTFTHWFVTRCMMIAIAVFVMDDGLFKLFILSLSMGMIIHDIGDLLTGGVRGYFWPLAPAKKNFRLASMPVGGTGEQGLIITIVALIMLQSYTLFIR